MKQTQQIPLEDDIAEVSGPKKSFRVRWEYFPNYGRGKVIGKIKYEDKICYVIPKNLSKTLKPGSMSLCTLGHMTSIKNSEEYKDADIYFVNITMAKVKQAP